MEHEERKHATYSPSSMAQIINCPISKVLDKDIPEPETSKYAEEGTKAHELAEKYLKTILSGEEIKQDCDDIEMHEHCKGYAQFVYSLVEPYLDFDHICAIEKKLTVCERLDVWGTADFVFYYSMPEDNHSNAIVVDFKYGRGVTVNAEDNWQLLTYAIGAIFEGLEDYAIKKIDTYIYQPRVENVISSKSYAFSELYKYHDRILHTIEVINDLKEKGLTKIDYEIYQKEGYWCRWCKVKDTCALVNQKNVDRIKSLFEKVTVKRGLLSDEDIAYIALNKSNLVTMINGIYDNVYKRALEGQEFKGLKLVKSSPRREFIEDIKTVVKGLKELGIESPVKQVEKLITITEAEEILGKGKLEHLCKKVDKKKAYTLVSVDDASKEVNIKEDIASMFKDVFNNKKS